MKAYLSVEIGVGKSECEDTAIFNETILNNKATHIDNPALLCIGVSDGVGGNAGGRIASRYIALQLSQADFVNMEEHEIKQFVEKLNAELIDYAATIPGKTEMASTLTCVVAAKDGYFLIHAGNTRLYVMQGSYLKQLTTDHTTYNWLMGCGQIEAAEQCNKSEINCCLGGGSLRYANHLVVSKLFDECPDTLILTSDGIHDFVDLDFMEETLVSSDSDLDAAKKISDIARKNGSKDDATIIILRR